MQFPTRLPTSPSSPGFSSNEGCSDISSLWVGEQTATLHEEPHTTSLDPSSLPPQTKRGLESEYFAASTMNNDDVTLSTSDKEDVASPDFGMTDIHKRISCAVRTGAEWQQDLCHLYGLTEAESCECFSRAVFHSGNDTFPDDATNEKLFQHAKQRWFPTYQGTHERSYGFGRVGGFAKQTSRDVLLKRTHRSSTIVRVFLGSNIYQITVYVFPLFVRKSTSH